MSESARSQAPKTIYLVNRQDKYCPEKNNGDYIVAIYTTRARAEATVKFLDKKLPTDEHFVIEMLLDTPDEEIL